METPADTLKNGDVDVASKACLSCGNPLDEAELFCGACGGKVMRLSELPERIAALIIDYSIFCGLAALTLIPQIRRISGDDYFAFTFTVSWYFVPPYLMVTEGAFAGSFGKRIMGLRVVRADGRPCGYLRALVRNVFRVIDGLFFYLIGAQLIRSSARRQRLGDMVARTYVVPVAEMTQPQVSAAYRLVFGIGVPVVAGMLAAGIFTAVYADQVATTEAKYFGGRAQNLIIGLNRDIDRAAGRQQQLVQEIPDQLESAEQIRKFREIIVACSAEESRLAPAAKTTYGSLVRLAAPDSAKAEKSVLADFYRQLLADLAVNKREIAYMDAILGLQEEYISFASVWEKEPANRNEALSNLNFIKDKSRALAERLNRVKPPAAMVSVHEDQLAILNLHTRTADQLLAAFDRADINMYERVARQANLDFKFHSGKIERDWRSMVGRSLLAFKLEVKTWRESEARLRRFNRKYDTALTLPRPVVLKKARPKEKEI